MSKRKNSTKKYLLVPLLTTFCAKLLIILAGIGDNYYLLTLESEVP